MATVIKINISQVATQILRIISLYPPVPVQQNYFNQSNNPVFVQAENYTRDESLVSFGFPHSIDSPYALIDPYGVYSVPLNAYSFGLPSFVNNTVPNPNTDIYSIILMDVDVALIEPGFSRLRIDYVNSSGEVITEYTDMPFYPKWDTHPREIEEIRQYAEESITFLQREINQLDLDILQVLNRMQTKGFHVSGQVYATQATNTQPFINPVSHELKVQNNLNEKFLLLKNKQDREMLEMKSFVYSIISYPATVYALEQFTVTMNELIHPNDVLCINGFPLTTTVSGSAFIASLPNAANFNYEFNLAVFNAGKQVTASVPLTVKAVPIINSVNNGQYASIGTTIQIFGSNFGFSGSIVFNGINANIINWSNTIITLVVPNISSSYGTLTNQDGKSVMFQLNTFSTVNTFTVSPEINQISFGQTINYQALYNGNEVKPNWSLENSSGNFGNGNLSIGFIDNDGNYTAPSNVGLSFSIGIVANYITSEGNYYNKASLVVANNNSTLTISPSSVILEPSFTQLYSLKYNGSSVDLADVQWYINGILNGNSSVGTIGQDGIYLAPSFVPINQTIHLDAIYNNETITAIIRIVAVGQIINNDLESHNLEILEEKTTYNAMSLSYMRSVAYNFCGASNQYYGAPGVLSEPSSGYNEFFLSDLFVQQQSGGTRDTLGYSGTYDFVKSSSLTTSAVTHGETEYLDALPMGFYIAEARDSKGKRCVVAVFGLTSSPSAFSAAYNQKIPYGYGSLGLQLTINASSGSLSNNSNITTTELSQYSYYGGQGWTVDSRGQSLTQQSSVNSNFTNGVIQPFAASSTNGYASSFDLPTGLKVSDQFIKFLNNNVVNTPLIDNSVETMESFTQLSQASRVDAFYYFNQPVIGTLNSLLQYPDATQTGLNLLVSGNPFSNNFSFLPDALWDMVPSGDGSYFARAIFYPSSSCSGLEMSDLFNFWTTLVGGTNPNTDNTTLMQTSFNLLKYLSAESSGYNAPNAQQTPAYLNFSPISSGPPTPTVNSATNACPNSTINVYGTNFSSDAQVYFTSTNQILPLVSAPSTSDGTNYVISVTVPNNVSQQPNSYAIYVKGSNGTSNNNVTFSVPNGCVIYPITLTVSPPNTTIDVNTTEQFTAIYQDIHGNQNDVSSSVIWYTNSTQGGTGQYGVIDSTGLYSAPVDIPDINPVAIQATYNGSGQNLQASTSVTITSPFLGPPPPPPPSLHHGCYMLRVSPDNTIITVPGNPFQFTAELYIDDANPQPVYAQWSVNSIPGGNATLGTIDSTGLYYPPSTGYPPLDFPYIKVEANYTTTPVAPDTTPLNLLGYSVVGFTSVEQQSAACLLKVTEQINVFFGDGRCGYVPSGTQITLNPGEYLVGTYQESLNTALIPYNDMKGDQLLPLSLLGVQANNLSYSLYNEGTIVQTANVGEINAAYNLFAQPFTVVLGVCDPNDGRFHSAWDLIPVVLNSGSVGTIPLQPNTCVISHSMEIVEKNLEEPKTLENIINDKIQNIDTISTVNKYEKFWTGQLTFDGINYVVLQDLNLFKYDLEKNSYEIKFTEKSGKKFEAKNGILYFDEENNILKTIPDDTKNIKQSDIIAMILDKLYSPWSFIQIINKENLIEEKSNGIQIGNAFIEWHKNQNMNYNKLSQIVFGRKET